MSCHCLGVLNKKSDKKKKKTIFFIKYIWISNNLWLANLGNPSPMLPVPNSNKVNIRLCSSSVSSPSLLLSPHFSILCYF